MRIELCSVLVDDQAKALAFYTEKLGFQKKTNLPMGQHRWLTVVSHKGDARVELVLEPMAFPPARTYQRALYEAGIPATAFISKDVHTEYALLRSRGVQFRAEPVEGGGVTFVLFDDTCGNLISLVQVE